MTLRRGDGRGLTDKDHKFDPKTRATDRALIERYKHRRTVHGTPMTDPNAVEVQGAMFSDPVPSLSLTFAYTNEAGEVKIDNFKRENLSVRQVVTAIVKQHAHDVNFQFRPSLRRQLQAQKLDARHFTEVMASLGLI